MSSSASAPMSSSATSLRRNSDDPGWKYGELVSPNDLNTVKCVFCGHCSKGGISRFKQHLAHIKGNVASCKKVPSEVKKEIEEHINHHKKKKTDKEQSVKELRAEVRISGTHDADDNEVEELSSIGTKRPRPVGPMDRFLAIDPEDAVKARGKSKQWKQTSIKDPFLKEKRDRVNQFVANWIYEAGIPFHATTLKSFDLMLEAVGQYGSGYTKPSEYEFSEPLLKKAVERTNQELQCQRDAWKKTGCSIMTDAWTDRKSRSIMNLCVNCERGTSFLRSIDASAEAHTASYIHELIDSCIEEVGEGNVVQVVTDNASNNVAAANILKEKRPKIFWSFCAAHTLDLMLESIGKKHFKNVIDKARSLTIFIYSHHKTLSMMRKTVKGEIIRPGITRFATAFLSLQSLAEKKEKLRLMFTSEEWVSTKWYNTQVGKKVTAMVLSTNFWGQVTLAIKVFVPLVRVLRIADGEARPSMGFIYGGLIDAIKEIKATFKGVETSYKPFTDIVESRMEGKLDSPLHVAAYYLNPFYFYRDADIIQTSMKVNDGLFSCMETFYPDVDIQDKITSVEMKAFKDASGLFGRQVAVRQRSSLDDNFNPAHWWATFGSTTPYLQAMAIRILNLTCSSSGCERNWSTFEGEGQFRGSSGSQRGKRIIAGRVVKESYGATKQQHTFTVEILWSKGVKPLPPLFPLLVKGRNLYKLKTFRQIDLSSHIIRVLTKLKVENAGPGAASEVLLAFPNIKAKNLANIMSLYYEGKGKGKGSSLSLPLESVHPEGMPPELTFFSISLPKGLEKGVTATIDVLAVYTHSLTPFPEEITQADVQLVVFEDNAYYLSPYEVKFQTLAIRLPGGRIESYTKYPNTKFADSEIRYGPFENLPAFSYAPITVHFENNHPFAVAQDLVREIEISHWGNIKITEHYSLVHGGARNRGGFSRLDYQSRSLKGVSSFRHLIARLPPRAHSVYYRDDIGNISTSHLWSDSKKTQLELEPRFPLFGGWRASFTIGYGLPLKDYLFESEGRRFLNITFGCPMAEVVIDHLIVKVVLPEGSKEISVSVPFPVKQWQEVKSSHLDIVGRPVVVLEKTNVVPEHTLYFQVYYKFNNFSLLLEPIMLILGFFFLFTACVLYVHTDVSISKSSPSYLAKLQWDEVQATVQEVQNIIKRYISVHDRLEASLQDLSRTGDLQSCKAIKKTADSLFKEFTKELKPFLGFLQTSPQAAHIWPKVDELVTKEKEMQEKLLVKHSTVVDCFEKKTGGREIENRIASYQQKIVTLRNEIDDLLEIIDEI